MMKRIVKGKNITKDSNLKFSLFEKDMLTIHVSYERIACITTICQQLSSL